MTYVNRKITSICWHRIIFPHVVIKEENTILGNCTGCGRDVEQSLNGYSVSEKELRGKRLYERPEKRGYATA